MPGGQAARRPEPRLPEKCPTLRTFPPLDPGYQTGFFLKFISSCAGTVPGGTRSGLERDALRLAEDAGSGRLRSSGRFQLLHKLRLHAKCIMLYNN